MKPKRVTAPGSCASVVAEFDDVISGSCNVEMDPDARIPFSKIWNISESGVHRLMAPFGGDNDSTYVFNGAGITLGSHILVFMKLSGSYKQFLYTHFKAFSSTEMEIKQRIDIRTKWYGTINGLHSHESIKILRTKHERRCGYICFICLVNGGHSLDRYRQLARFQNVIHDASFYIYCTFYDLTSNLKF